MSFVQLEFVGLMATVYALYWLGRGRLWQNSVLLAGSICFYGWFVPWWVALLWLSATLDFAMGQLMVRARPQRKLWLAISLCANIGLLLYFKYLGFFVENVAEGLRRLGVEAHPPVLEILLPVGISFYTFQTLSYTIDVYRGELKPRRSYLDYLVFVSFFPQLVAGPIERAARLLPQIERVRRFDLADLRAGFGLVMYGAFKKIVLADTLAPYIDKVFVLDEPSGPLVWTAAAAFGVQIYADFSGYTDLARGTARMLGVRIVRNFNEPYLAATTPEFWQRWHMSLTSWIRDYLLTPLLGTGNVIGIPRFAGALVVTMVIMGAWHGAGWNYIAFGLYHSAWILTYVVVQRRMPAWAASIPSGRKLAVAFHSIFVLLPSTLLFREPSLGRFFEHLSQSPVQATGDEWRAVIVLLALVALANGVFTIEHHARRQVVPRLQGSPWFLLVQSTLWSALGVAIVVFYRTTQYDFIYFQF